jgi:hypothetical protein
MAQKKCDLPKDRAASQAVTYAAPPNARPATQTVGPIGTFSDEWFARLLSMLALTVRL